MELDYKVYYVIQTVPKYRVCGYSFNKKEANAVANKIKEITDVQGYVIEFTRSELKELGYK